MITLAELIAVLDLREPARATAATLARKVTSITSDSRQVVAGSLFVAIRGEKADGHAYVQEAARKGCLAVVVETANGLEPLTVPLLLVADSHMALCQAAALWHGNPAQQLSLIGITGTNGKTTTSWLIEGMLVQAGLQPGVIGTVNYRYHDESGCHVIQEAPLTTPDPVTLQGLLRTMVEHRVTHVIMEISSHALDQNRLGTICFDVALFTNLSRDHLDYHQTMERYFAAKLLLFERHLKPSGVAVLVCGEGKETAVWTDRLAALIRASRVICCGTEPECEVSARNLSVEVAGIRCHLLCGGKEHFLHSKLTGRYNVFNVLAAAGAGIALGLTSTAIVEGLARIDAVPGRLERVSLAAGTGASYPAVFVDYAHTPDALENVLQSLRQLAKGRLICVMGCGGDRDRGKRPLMGGIAIRLSDVVLITSDNPRTEEPSAIIAAVAEGAAAGGGRLRSLHELFGGGRAERGYAVVVDRRQAIATACNLAAVEDTVLVAGKGHENYQILGRERIYFDDRREAANGLARWNERHLLAATDGTVMGGRHRQVMARVTTDSRKIEPGDVFVALRGEQYDGHAFIETAVTKGAAAVVAERMPSRMEEDVLYVQVDDTLRALGQMAYYRRGLFAHQVRVAAVTGSSGKTTVKEVTARIFAEALADEHVGVDPLLKTRGNLNNLVGLPLSLLPIEAGHRLAILEMGMNAPGEIARLAAIADPDIGCINNVHPAHLQGLGSIEGVAAAKGELFAGMRPEAVRIVNCDDPMVLDLARKSGGRQLKFAVTAAGRRRKPEVSITRLVNLGERGYRFTLHVGSWSRRCTVPMPGNHNVSNCAAAAAIAHAAGIDPERIVAGLQAYEPVDKRLNVTHFPGGLRLVNDAYNANPASMAAGLRTVAAFGGDCRRFAALGDMLELGSASPVLHRGIGTLVAELGYDWLAVTGEQAKEVAGAAHAAGMQTARVRIFPEPRAMAEWVCALLTEGALGAGDWLLVKGSRGMRMERLIEELALRLRQAG